MSRLLLWLLLPTQMSAFAAHAATHPCEQFSEPFYQLALVRASGKSKEAVLSMIRNDASPEGRAVEAYMVEAVDLVFAHGDLAASELKEAVRSSCKLDAEGKIEFNGIIRREG